MPRGLDLKMKSIRTRELSLKDGFQKKRINVLYHRDFVLKGLRGVLSNTHDRIKFLFLDINIFKNMSHK